MADLPVTDRTRFESQERLDKPDAESFLALADEALQRVLGAVLGRCGGVSSPPKVTFSGAVAPQKLTFGAFHYLASSPKWTDDNGTTYKGWKVGAYLFDPLAASQGAVLDVSAVWTAAAAGQPAGKPFVYVRPVLWDMDTDGRRKWVGAADTGVAIKTRRRIRHEFKTSTMPPSVSENDGWAPVVKIHDWSNFGGADPGVPTLRYISFLDSNTLVVNTNQTDDGTNWTGSTTNMHRLLNVLADKETFSGTAVENVFPDDTADKDMGLVQVLHLLRSRMVRLLDSNRTKPWFYNPLGSDNANDKGFLQLVDDSDTILARPFVHATARVDVVVGVWTLFAGDGIEAAAKNVTAVEAVVGSPHIAVLTMTAIPTGHKTAGLLAALRFPSVGYATVYVSTALTVWVSTYNTAGVGTALPFFVQVLAVKT